MDKNIESKVLEIVAFYRSGDSYASIAEKTKSSKSFVSSVLRELRKRGANLPSRRVSAVDYESILSKIK